MNRLTEPLVIVSGALGSGFAIQAQSIIGIIGSILFTLYFGSMLYFKIVKPHYKGKWSSYFKGLILFFKNK